LRRRGRIGIRVQYQVAVGSLERFPGLNPPLFEILLAIVFDETALLFCNRKRRLRRKVESAAMGG